MHTFIVEHNVNHFATLEEDAERLARVQKLFELPFPEKLKVTLSSESIKKIQYFYSFMKENKITKLEFYIRGTGNSFVPLNRNMSFETNEYLDFGEVFFKTFKIDSARVELDKFYENITFQFLYNNGWAEECFDYSHSIKPLLSL